MTCPRPYLTWTISTNLFSCLYKVNTYYDLKQKSSEYLQSTLVFTKEREEVEKMATAEAKKEADKTIHFLEMLLMNRHISKTMIY